MSDNPFAEPDDDDRTVVRAATTTARRPASPRRAMDGRGAETSTDATSTTATHEARPGGAATADATLVESRTVAPVAAEEPARITSGGETLLDLAAPLVLLLARLRNMRSPPDPAALHDRAVAGLRAFEARARAAGIDVEALRPAHYALCASLDDVVLATDWGSTSIWNAHSLVSTFHQEVQSGERFFRLLDTLRQSPARFLPVIELMYLCLSLGFEGRCRLSPRGASELATVREETYAVIARLRKSADPALSPHWQGVTAPYRPARGGVPVWVAGAASLALLGALFAWVSTGLNAGSDALFERMVTAPPAVMPQIARAAPVTAPPPPPPAAQPTALDRLRTFLKPEVDQGLVAVLGTPSAPVVRILSHDIFASGSASINPQLVPLLERIGLALKAEQGSVLVAGYTDNVPIRTVRFPSNFQLSAARAQAAKAVIDRVIGDPSRVTAEGRADADPIASNATPQGREQNRRIEITLRRPE